MTANERSEGRTETVTETVIAIDSVYVHDSVYIREAGDTVFIDRWHIQWRDRVVHDTVLKHTTDTVVLTNTEKERVEVPGKGGKTGWAVAFSLMFLITIYILIKTFLKRH